MDELKSKTGLDLKEWVKVLRRDGPPGADKAAQRAWLKQRHGLGHVQAGIVVDEAAGGQQRVYEDPVALVDAQYAGAKAELRPLYDALVHIAKRLGSDVRVEPCQTYVPFIRKNQFAVVKPATKTRVDLGLALPELKPQGRLKASRGLGGGDRITHKIELSDLGQVDADVVRWMKKAYELARVPVPAKAAANAKASSKPGSAGDKSAMTALAEAAEEASAVEEASLEDGEIRVPPEFEEVETPTSVRRTGAKKPAAASKRPARR